MIETIKVVLLFAMLFIPACGNYRTIEVELFRADDPENIILPEKDTQALLDQAGAIIGYEIVPVRKAPIIIELVDTGERIAGRAWRRGYCRYYIRSTYRSHVLAHEMGHVLGLGHTDQRGNLMTPNVGGVDLTNKQRRRMRKRARRIERLCWDNTEPSERSAPIGPALGDQPEHLCPEQALGEREEAGQGLGRGQEGATVGDEDGTTGLREDSSSTGWPVFLQWLRP